MKEHARKFYVTTPLYYVTAKPHLGSLYSTVLADVAARWHKLRGIKTFFLTGTDEHGQKIAYAAERVGKEPKEFVDSFIDAYKDMWSKYHIEYSYFIRTTDTHHVKAVQDWIKKLIESGDIYKSHYAGYYCTPCETYVAEKGAVTNEPSCDQCGRPTTLLSEESYFFRLSAYQDRLLQYYQENPDFIIPSERLNEVLRFVESGLRDLSISRTTVKWGIPFPGDEQHIVYVWADALNNYITAIGYGTDQKKDDFHFWWPADLQVLGKDIVRFHGVYWPAFLMASGLPLPHHLLVHGWIKVNQKKMSKSFGNVVDPQLLLDDYGADEVRYYLTRFMAITHDSEFSTYDLESRITSDLANDLGNLLHRVLILAQKNDLYEVVPPGNWGPAERKLRDTFWTELESYETEMDDAYYHKALGHLWSYINNVNAYVHSQEPWKIKDRERFIQVISAACNSLYAIGIALYPVMPHKMESLLESLGVTLKIGQEDYIEDISENPWNHTFLLRGMKEPLFVKHNPKKEEALVQEKPKELAPISIDDFVKVIHLVGTIKSAEEVEGSDRLLKLSVDFGEPSTRQVLSGIKEYYSPADIVGKQAVFVTNLKPRKIMGLESQAMILTVFDANKKLQLVTVENVPNGTRLK